MKKIAQGKILFSCKNKRWANELRTIIQSENKNIEISDLQKAVLESVAIILVHGPPNSPFEGYVFRVQYDAKQIPLRPPKIRFIDIPWSPFIDLSSGKVCCDILHENWSPVLNLETVMISIISLLSETKLEKHQVGLNIEATAEINISYKNYFKNARQYASEHHYQKAYHYLDEAKPPFDLSYSEISLIEDGRYQQIKQKFIKNPNTQIKRDRKMKKYDEQIEPAVPQKNPMLFPYEQLISKIDFYRQIPKQSLQWKFVELREKEKQKQREKPQQKQKQKLEQKPKQKVKQKPEQKPKEKSEQKKQQKLKKVSSQQFFSLKSDDQQLKMLESLLNIKSSSRKLKN